MQEFFVFVSRLMDGSLYLAFSGAILWGIMSVILSPCHIASIPLIVAYITGQKNKTRKKAFLVSTVFSLGIMLIIAIIGFITASAGKIMGDIGSIGNYIVAVVLLATGTYMLDLYSINFGGLNLKGAKKNILGAFLLGLLFGFALGPCTFAYMAPVFAGVYKLAPTNPIGAHLLYLMFAIGHCGIIIIAGTFFEVIVEMTSMEKSVKIMNIIKKHVEC